MLSEAGTWGGSRGTGAAKRGPSCGASTGPTRLLCFPSPQMPGDTVSPPPPPSATPSHMGRL